MSTAAVVLRRGMRFESRVWLDPTYMPEHRPALCLVTAVRAGMVYYRPDYGLHDDGTPWLGSAACFPVEQTARWVGRVVEEPRP